MGAAHKFGLDELNFVLTFAGFPIITTLVPAVPSIAIRGIALVIALMCLLKNHFSMPFNRKAFKCFFIILILVDLRVLLECMLAEPVFTQSRNMCLLFTYGVILIPCMAFYSGYSKIDWKITLYVLWGALFLMLIKGAMSINISLDTDATRVDLNDRQSTLVLGDFGGYEVIIAIALLIENARNKCKFKGVLFFVLVLSIIVGFFDMAKAGSRGPFVSLLAGIFMIFLVLDRKYKIICLCSLAVFIVIGGVSLSKLADFAPVLFYRFEATFVDGDFSGRDDLLKIALNMILSNPLLGGNPVVFIADGEYSTYHNGFIDVCLALGVIGFIVYLILILKLMSRSIQKKYAFDVPEYVFLAGMLGAMVARSLTGAGLFSNSTYTLIIGMAAICFSKPLLLNTIYQRLSNGNRLI